MGSTDDGPRRGEMRSIFASTTGGVMTVEVGTVTGELEVVTRPTEEGTLEVLVRYAGAEEWYAVEGSPITQENVADLSSSELSELHESIIRRLTRPGRTVDGNEEPTTLSGFSP